MTTALAMTREAFERIRDDFGIDFSAVAFSYDDYVTAWLLVKSGTAILTTNKVIAYHRHRLRWGDCVTQLSRSGQGAGVMVRHYADCPLSQALLRRVLIVLGLMAGTFLVALVSLLIHGLTALWVMLFSELPMPLKPKMAGGLSFHYLRSSSF